MRVLVIPDVHLKPFMFKRAAVLMRSGVADQAVCLMDVADDWGKEYDIFLYEETYDAAISFAKEFPNTLWCWGNHDLSYIWHCLESGYSSMASFTVQRKILELKEALPKGNKIQYVHKIDNVLFSHGGVASYFVEEYVPQNMHDDVERVVDEINKLGKIQVWNDASPIWIRPQWNAVRLFKQENILQIVGHTPMEQLTRKDNLISCDVFSTYRDGRNIGTEEFLIIDTITWEYRGIRHSI